MNNLKVFIEGGGADYKLMFEQRGFVIVDTHKQADLICFTGGADVDPYLYNEAKHPLTGCNPDRDNRCLEIFGYAIINDIPMCGICRGSQFLCVANGGRLWQHVDHHAVGRGHEATTDDGRVISVTSTHHQMMRPEGIRGQDYELVLTARESVHKEFMQYGKVVSTLATLPDVEGVIWPDTRSFGFQPHPEFRGAPVACTEFFFEKLQEIL